VRLANLCDCGSPLFARYDLGNVRREDLRPRRDLWRYAPILPLDEDRVQSRGEGGTPLHRLTRIGSGGRVARLKVATLHVKDEGLNPTGTFKARGMAVAIPTAQALGAASVIAPTAGNAGAALALYAATYGLDASILMTADAPAEARRCGLDFGAKVLQVDGDITDAGRLAQQISAATGAFNLATLREPYRVEGKKTMLLEIWEDLGGMPDWILFPTGGGTGVAGIWKALGSSATSDGTRERGRGSDLFRRKAAPRSCGLGRRKGSRPSRGPNLGRLPPDCASRRPWRTGSSCGRSARPAGLVWPCPRRRWRSRPRTSRPWRESPPASKAQRPSPASAASMTRA